MVNNIFSHMISKANQISNELVMSVTVSGFDAKFGFNLAFTQINIILFA